MKICTTCKESKNPTEFHKDSRIKSGLRSSCKSCVSEWTAQQASKPPVLDPKVTHKSCPRCKREDNPHMHPVAHFGLARRRVDGRNSWCKRCCVEVSSAWQQTEVGKQKHSEAVTRYRRRNQNARIRSAVDGG